MSKPSNPQKAPKSHGPKPPASGGHRNSKGGHNTGEACCPMVAAVSSVKRGKFRLAARYARWSFRLLAARIA